MSMWYWVLLIVLCWLAAAAGGGMWIGRWLRRCRYARDARHAAAGAERPAEPPRRWESIPFKAVRGRPPWPPAEPPDEWTEVELAVLRGDVPLFGPADERVEAFGEWAARMAADIAGWQGEDWAA